MSAGIAVMGVPDPWRWAGACLIVVMAVGAAPAQVRAALEDEIGTADWVAGVDPPRGAAQTLSEGEAITLLEPLRLRRAISDATLARLSGEAERAYQGRDLKTAHHLYQQVVALDRTHAGAWFRLGTIHQQAGQLQAASDAYRQALRILAQPGSGAGTGSEARAETRAEGDASLRARALLNLALIGHWRARLALAELDRQPGDPSFDAQRQQIDRDLLAVEHRLGTEGRRWPQTVIIEPTGARARATARERGATRHDGPSAASGTTTSVASSRPPAGPSSLAPSISPSVPAAGSSSAPHPMAGRAVDASATIERASARQKVEHLQGLPDRAPAVPTRGAVPAASPVGTAAVAGAVGSGETAIAVDGGGRHVTGPR